MLAMKTSSGYAVPIKDFDMVQKKNLRAVKYDKRQIADMEKLSTFYPEIRFKNVSRVNSDESIDIIIDTGVANELHTGFLPKRFYKAIRVKKEKKGLLGFKWSYLNTIQVSEADIISQFNQTVSIDEVEAILEATTKKGVKYFG
ncbi:hypothetical protein [Enterococcus avium]|uniref:Transposase n=1 Tax=Enterococcus avium TaxID=33945 RepID=A0ABD5F4N2_ENTAV|nr:hypothetical protein [Enterococcus avium]MDT2484128.1 hypothetical protein [Enterococcus avium]MDT2510682.1 hypothetical protein [Enterococcus avium]MDT2513357.1 hypothetical protein [Enterococcus avium]